jgi:hypothetical protein
VEAYRDLESRESTAKLVLSIGVEHGVEEKQDAHSKRTPEIHNGRIRTGAASLQL